MAGFTSNENDEPDDADEELEEEVDEHDSCPKCGASCHPDWSYCPTCGCELPYEPSGERSADDGYQLGLDYSEYER